MQMIDQNISKHCILLPPCFGPFDSTATFFSNAPACTCQESWQTVHKKCRKPRASCWDQQADWVRALLPVPPEGDPSPSLVDCENASESKLSKMAAAVGMHCIPLLHVLTRGNKKQTRFRSNLFGKMSVSEVESYSMGDERD